MGWGDIWSNIQEGASDLYEDAKGAVDDGANWFGKMAKTAGYGSQSLNETDNAAFEESAPGFSDKNREFLIKQYDRMNMGDSGISEDDFINNMYKFSQDTRMMESDNDPNARNKTSSATGVYQFTDDSINTGRQRMQNMGWEEEDYSGIGDDATQWTDDQADSMFLSNMFAQKGSDEYLAKVGGGEEGADKDAYYKFHHTDPDVATTDRADDIYGGNRDTNKSTTTEGPPTMDDYRQHGDY